MKCAAHASTQAATLRTGAEQMENYLPLLKGKRIALLVNQTARVGKQHLVDTLLSLHVQITKIFSPEHGFRGNADAGEPVNNSRDEQTGLPIVSLYGTHHKPSKEDLQEVDLLIYDIQDVGARFYTYISSLQELMEAAAENNIPLLILDRPNPNGFYTDGPVLDKTFTSFVGMQRVPIVHGMTVGEYAQMLNGEHWLSNPKWQCELTVIACQHYTHKTLYQLPVKPSPNLPNMAAIYLYPSLCLFEGTALSIGRGTDKPFQVFGHPSLPKDLYAFTPRSLPGAKHPPLLNQTCYGYNLSDTVAALLKKPPHHIQLQWILQAYRLFPEKEKFFNNYFNKLAGNDQLIRQIQNGASEEEIRQSWEPALRHFKKIRKKYLLYPDFE